MAKKTKTKRIFYFDALRALAIISVITYHVFGSTDWIASKEFITGPTFNWIVNCFLGSNKIGVDIFLMLSGALSLGRQWDIRSFLSRRLPRITAPYLFWGLALSVFMFLSLIYIPDLLSDSVSPITSLSVMGFLTYLYNAYIAANPGTSQFWFFWLILGTYLIMPVLNKWLLHSDLREAEYFLVFWIITCICQYTLNVKFPIKLDYFAGTIGLVVLGYYLRHTERRILNNPYFALLLTLIGCLSSMYVMYLGFVPGNVVHHNDRLSIYLVVEIIGIFLLFKNFGKFNLNIGFLNNPDGVFRKAVFTIARYSYGMYLNHIVIMLVLLKLFSGFGYLPLVVVSIVGTVGISCLAMALLNRIPYLNQVIGAK